MINIKTILGAAALAVGGSIYFGKGKYDQYKGVADKLQVKLKSIKGISLKDGHFVFDVDVELENPTETAINVPGDAITIKKLYFFSPSGTALGEASPNLSQITLPANGTRLITNVPARVKASTVGASFTEFLQVASDPKQLNITADIEAFGKSFTL